MPHRLGTPSSLTVSFRLWRGLLPVLSLFWMVATVMLLIPGHDALVAIRSVLAPGPSGKSFDLCRIDNERPRFGSFETRIYLQAANANGVSVITVQQVEQKSFQHALAILTMPESSLDRIANEAIIEAVLPTTSKLSIVLRCQNGVVPSTAALRRYVGEVYSQLWDVALAADRPETTVTSRTPPENNLPNAIVYPQNLPNVAPESWIDIQPDLDCICSHDATIGWTSAMSSSSTAAQRFALVPGQGMGGLDEHVANVNRERSLRNLKPLQALPVTKFPQFVSEIGASRVCFLEDEEPLDNNCADSMGSSSMLAGAAPTSTQNLYDSVCVGGTFDGLHFGHRKLLTLAVSSVTPVTGTLLVGVTVDAMLRKKAFCEYIPTLAERCDGVTQFLHRLAPGMINRISVVPITDAFGPPGQASPRNKFDAIVLSHETLHTGYLLNQHRVQELGLPPLQLLCTRRTEAHGMSSTALRRLRQQRHQEKQQQQSNGNVVVER
jgi:pantetheine-phosphate adenylyltransferase